MGGLSGAAWAFLFVLAFVGRASGLGQWPVLACEILLMPYAVCRVACLYLGSQSTETAPLCGASPAGSVYDAYGSWLPAATPSNPTVGLYTRPAGVGGVCAAPSPTTPARPDVATEGAVWVRASDPLVCEAPAPAVPPVVPPCTRGEPDPSWLSG